MWSHKNLLLYSSFPKIFFLITVLKVASTALDVESERFLGHSEMSGTLGEYMMYFVGLGEGESLEVDTSVLSEELPYEPEDVLDDLDRLEEEDYIESVYDSIHPDAVEGFNEIMDRTEFRELDPSSYRLGGKSREFIEKTDIDRIEESLKYVFRNAGN
jgi:hypothetical protein